MEVYRISEEASVYFVTYSVVSWLPVFITETSCKIVTDSLLFSHEHRGLRVNAFVIMPTHMHAIVFDSEHDPACLSETLDAFRRFTGHALADHCASSLPRVFADALRESACTDRHRRFWQPTRHPTAIRNERFWRQKVDYVHANPVRRGLVRYAEDWRFSSARYYADDGGEAEDVLIAEIQW